MIYFLLNNICISFEFVTCFLISEGTRGLLSVEVRAPLVCVVR